MKLSQQIELIHSHEANFTITHRYVCQSTCPTYDSFTEHVYCKPQSNVLCPDDDFDGNDSEVACEDSDEFLKVLH